MSAPTKKTERFQTVQALGEDLVGRLELATDSQNGSTVLIRRFPVRFFPDPAASQGFLNRVKALAAQKRDGFQRVLALGSVQGEPWIACQGSQYGTLAQLPADTKLDAEAIGRLFESVAARLDQLHAEGRVHGDIRPQTLVFDPAGGLLVGEMAGVHALFQWGEGPVRLPAGAIGSIVSPDRVAPEVARTGVIDARADQYALALCLADCLGVRAAGGAAPAPLQAVFRFALSSNPADRFRSCTEMVQAVRTAVASARPPLMRKLALVLAPVAAVVVMFVLGNLVGNAAERNRVESLLEEQRAAIRRKFEVSIPTVASVTVVPSLATIDAQATSLIDALIQSEKSVQDAAFDKQYDRLMAASRLKMEIDFEGKVAIGANPNASAPVAILAPGDAAPKFGEAASPLQWQLALQIPEVGKGVESYQVVVRALDAQRKPIGTPNATPLDLGQLDQKLSGTIPAPEGGWQPGMTVSLEAALVAGRRDEVWQRFGNTPVSLLEWKRADVELSPSMVKERQPEGYSVPAGIDIEEGDLVRITATGAVRPATDDMYKIMEIPAKDNGPDGVKVTSENIKRYWVVSETANWAALLVRHGDSSKWHAPSPDFAVADRSLAGKVNLSINSVTHMDKKPIKESDARFWQPKGSFTVTVLRGRLTTSPDSVTDEAIRPRIMTRLARGLGVPEPEKAETARISGTWQASDGTTVQVIDSGKTVRLVQTEGTTFRKFEFTFDREENALVNRSGQLALKADTSNRTYDTDARIFLQGDESFSLLTEQMTVVDGQIARRQKQGLQLAFNRVWSKEEIEERKTLAQKNLPPVNLPPVILRPGVGVPGVGKPGVGTPTVGTPTAPPGVITPGVMPPATGTKPAAPKKPEEIKLAGVWVPEDWVRTTIEIREDNGKATTRVTNSEEYQRLTGVIEKTPDGYKITRWQVVYMNDAQRRSFDLNGEIKVVDENTLQITTDIVNFQIINGKAYETGRTPLGYISYWHRRPGKK